MRQPTLLPAKSERRTASRRVRFGQAIRGWRLRQDLTIAEVSRRLGISPTAITAWENGATLPRDRLVLRSLLGILDASADERSYIASLLGSPQALDEQDVAIGPEADYLEWMQTRLDQVRALQTQLGQLQEQMGLIQAHIDTHLQALADAAHRRLLCRSGGAAPAEPSWR